MHGLSLLSAAHPILSISWAPLKKELRTQALAEPRAQAGSQIRPPRQATFLPCAVVVRTWGERRCAEEERSSRWLSRSGCLRTPGLRALVGLRLVDASAASDELAAGDAAFTSVSERREEESAP